MPKTLVTMPRRSHTTSMKGRAARPTKIPCMTGCWGLGIVECPLRWGWRDRGVPELCGSDIQTHRSRGLPLMPTTIQHHLTAAATHLSSSPSSSTSECSPEPLCCGSAIQTILPRSRTVDHGLPRTESRQGMPDSVTRMDSHLRSQVPVPPHLATLALSQRQGESPAPFVDSSPSLSTEPPLPQTYLCCHRACMLGILLRGQAASSKSPGSAL